MSRLSTSDWIEVVGIAVTSIIAVMIYIFGRKITLRQRLQNQHKIQNEIQKSINAGVELYNSRLYYKKYFYENVKDAFRGYCYLGCEIRGYSIDGIECISDLKKWRSGISVENVGILPYEWIQYIKYGGDGSTSKDIIFVKAPWFRFPYRRTVYYQYTKKDKMKNYQRIKKPLDQKIYDAWETFKRKVKYNLVIRWEKR